MKMNNYQIVAIQNISFAMGMIEAVGLNPNPTLSADTCEVIIEMLDEARKHVPEACEA